MITNFTEYWEQKKEVFEKLGVSKEVASMIWCDAADCLSIQLMLKFNKE